MKRDRATTLSKGGRKVRRSRLNRALKRRYQQYFCGKRGLQETGQICFVEFQNLVAKTFNDTKRAILDTRTAILFLKTRVRAPN